MGIHVTEGHTPSKY